MATDSTEIYDLIISLGGECFLSKEIHESGTDRIHEYVTSSLVAEDALIINVQADEPLIDINSINGLADFMASNNYEYATLCQKFGEDEDLDDPNKVKVVFDGKGKHCISLDQECLLIRKRVLLIIILGYMATQPDS